MIRQDGISCPDRADTRNKRTDSDSAYGIVVNPEKSKTIVFKKEDMVIVLADDEVG